MRMVAVTYVRTPLWYKLAQKVSTGRDDDGADGADGAVLLRG